MGHQDVMDKKIWPDDLNLKGTGIIHKGRGEMSENAGPLPPHFPQSVCSREEWAQTLHRAGSNLRFHFCQMVEGLRVHELTYPGVFLQESLRGGRGHRWEEKSTKHCDHENLKKNNRSKRLAFWTVAWQRQVVRLCQAGLWIINDSTHTSLFKQLEFVKEISWLTEFLEELNSQVRGYASRSNAQTPTWGSLSKDPPLLLLSCCC